MMYLKSCSKCHGDMYVDRIPTPLPSVPSVRTCRGSRDPSATLAQPPQPKAARKRDASKGSGKQIAA